MKKRRVTLNLDEEVVAALEAAGARSLSAAANEALHRAVAADAHRAALTRWLDELDDQHGRATEEESSEVEALLDDLAGSIEVEVEVG